MPEPSTSMLDPVILLAEQDDFIRKYLSSALQSLGGGIVLVARTGEEAADQFAECAGAAVAAIDVALAATRSWGTAHSLIESGIPFVLLASRAGIALPEELRHVPVMTWPFAAYQLFEALVRVAEPGCSTLPPAARPPAG